MSTNLKFEERFLKSEDRPNIILVNRYLVQSAVNPSKSFVYESYTTKTIGETVFIDNEPHVILSRA